MTNIRSSGFIESVSNSTTSTLTASSTYTGTAEDVSQYNQIHVSMYQEPNVVPNGDENTAQGSMYVEFSDDSTNWDVSIPIVCRNGLFIPQTYIVVKKWFRVRYINDGGAAAITSLGTGKTPDTPRNQTTFRLKSILLHSSTKELGRTIDQSVNGSDPVSLNRSVIVGRNPSDSYTNVRVTSNDELLTSSVEGDENTRLVYSEATIDGNSYALLVDLSGTTNFPHDETGSVEISTLKVAVDRSNKNCTGSVSIGVITRIDGTDADIEYGFFVPFKNSDVLRVLSINNWSPSRLKFSTSGGAWTGGITNEFENNQAGLNTGTTIKCTTGTNTAPAVGDIVARFLESGTGNYDVTIELDYHTEA